MPNKNDTILINGKPTAKRHLLLSKQKMFHLFKKTNKEFKKSFTRVLRLISRNYRKLDLTCRRVCVYTKHYNIEQKVKALDKLAQKKDMLYLLADVRKISDSTVCPFNDLPERKCVDRDCDSCGTDSVKRMYCPLLVDTNADEKDTQVKYH